MSSLQVALSTISFGAASLCLLQQVAPSTISSPSIALMGHAPPWPPAWHRFPDDGEMNRSAISVVRNAHVQRAGKEAHEDKTSLVDVISSIAPRLEECSGSSWATCFNAFQTTEGHSRWGRCRSPAQPSSRLSFRFTIGLDPVEWHISTKTGLSSLGIITGLVGQDKVWGRRGEEKKLSHSVSQRPPVNGQSPQSLE